jgi:glyoxylase-like metal-dependent hydrolase (beta-lactamase superfamily II)
MTTEVVPGVHRLGSSLVNWYLVEDEGGVTAVDAGLPAFEKTLDADLHALGHTRSDVAAVVLTHSDSDHTSLVPALRDAGARVLIHADDEATLRNPKAKTGDAAPRHLVPYLIRPGFWRHGTLFVGDALYMWNPLTGSREPQLGPSAFHESNEQAFASLAPIEGLDAEIVLAGHGEPWRGRPAEAVARARQIAGRH